MQSEAPQSRLDAKRKKRDHQRESEKKKRNQLFFEFRHRKYSFMQHPHTADSDWQCRRADSKEQHPNQKADKAVVENYVRHRLKGLKVGFCRKSSMAPASP